MLKNSMDSLDHLFGDLDNCFVQINNLKKTRKKIDAQLSSIHHGINDIVKYWDKKNRNLSGEITEHLDILSGNFKMIMNCLMLLDSETICFFKQYFIKIDNEMTEFQKQLMETENSGAVNILDIHQKIEKYFSPEKIGNEIYEILSLNPQFYCDFVGIEHLERKMTDHLAYFLLFYSFKMKGIDISKKFFTVIDKIIIYCDEYYQMQDDSIKIQYFLTEYIRNLNIYRKNISCDDIYRIINYKATNKKTRLLQIGLIQSFAFNKNRLNETYWQDLWLLEKYLMVANAIAKLKGYENIADDFTIILNDTNKYIVPEIIIDLMKMFQKNIDGPFYLENIYNMHNKNKIVARYKKDYAELIVDELTFNDNNHCFEIKENDSAKELIKLFRPDTVINPRREMVKQLKSTLKTDTVKVQPIETKNEPKINIHGLIFFPRLNPNNNIEQESKKIIRQIEEKKINPVTFDNDGVTVVQLTNTIVKLLQKISDKLTIKINTNITARFFIRNITMPLRSFITYKKGYNNFHPSGPGCRNYYIVFSTMNLNDKKYIVFSIKKTKEEQK